jgi:hypothetical protein
MIDIPVTIPGLRHWTGLGNNLTLPEPSRLIINLFNSNELSEQSKAITTFSARNYDDNVTY